MNDLVTSTLGVSDIAMTVQDRFDGPALPAETTETGTVTAFERMMRPTAEDRGVTIVRCRAEPDDMIRRLEQLSARELPSVAYDFRARNSAPRSYRRR
ncbi:hypothetical protein [Sphingomonas sp. 3-13AW]|uniref:hypothetical protein n=1 Tax=Sphingomonas sp. 3-13AW TaxID=3050450 RepID=UPI003BB6EC04